MRRPREHERAARGRQGGDVGQGVRRQDEPGGAIRARPLPGGALSECECARGGPSRVLRGMWGEPTRGVLIASPWLQTIGAAFVAKVMSVGDRTVTLGIWVSSLGT